MSRDVWKHAIKNAPVPERAQAAWEQLRTTAAEGTLANADAEQARILSALWSGSEWATEWLRKHPEWLGALTPQHQIGRASCRERGEISVVAGSLKKKR